MLLLLGATSARAQNAAAADPEALQQACNSGALQACYRLALLHESGDGVTKDTGRALDLYRRACASEGCFVNGFATNHGPRVERAKSAAALFEDACEKGIAVGCFDLGTLYDMAEGVPRDPARLDALWRKACDAGVLRGCNYLAQRYETGAPGLRPDPAKAVALFDKGCQEKHDTSSCYNLGLLYEKGKVVARDATRAAALFEKACDATADPARGGPGRTACYQAALLYLDDPARASRASALFRDLCDRGGQAACLMSSKDAAAPAPASRAPEIFKKACASGDNDACGVARGRGWLVTR
jgi:TPR repeat protein